MNTLQNRNTAGRLTAMTDSFLHRNAQDLAEEVLSDTPVLTISGARQVGKSTLVHQLLEGREHRFFNLDESASLASAQADPDGFVRQLPEGTLAIDEIQRAPELFRAIKGALEKDRRPGRFILTGSSNLLSLTGAEESLAGRAETIRLHGLSVGERLGIHEDFAGRIWSLKDAGVQPASTLSRADYFQLFCTPSFPGLRDSGRRRQHRWFAAYIERVLSKDAAQLYGIQFPDRLHNLLAKFAAQGTAELVAAHIGRALDIPERSVPTYVTALSDVFLINQLPSWGTNLEKRAISKPKVFLSDTALATSLAGLEPEALEMNISSTLSGGICEAFVANELLKQKAWSSVDYRLFHFRTSTGKEVDLVLESRSRDVVGVEVKAAMSIQPKDFAGLRYLQQVAGDSFRAGIVLYTGKDVLPMGENLWAMPISTLWHG